MIVHLTAMQQSRVRIRPLCRSLGGLRHLGWHSIVGWPLKGDRDITHKKIHRKNPKNMGFFTATDQGIVKSVPLGLFNRVSFLPCFVIKCINIYGIYIHTSIPINCIYFCYTVYNTVAIFHFQCRTWFTWCSPAVWSTISWTGIVDRIKREKTSMTTFKYIYNKTYRATAWYSVDFGTGGDRWTSSFSSTRHPAQHSTLKRNTEVQNVLQFPS